MSDRIAVMNAGRIEQVGSGDQIYSKPQTAFAASFVGEANQFHGKIMQIDGEFAQIVTSLGQFTARFRGAVNQGDQAILFVRPENMKIETGPNQMTGRLVRRDLEGPFMNLYFDVHGLDVSVHKSNTGQVLISDGEFLSFEPTNGIILPDGPVAQTGREIAAQ